jgi:hypothetical protein
MVRYLVVPVLRNLTAAPRLVHALVRGPSQALSTSPGTGGRDPKPPDEGLGTAMQARRGPPAHRCGRARFADASAVTPRGVRGRPGPRLCQQQPSARRAPTPTSRVGDVQLNGERGAPRMADTISTTELA